MALNAKATQEFVPIKEVRDGIIVLKDGGLRAIILANSTNLSLKSDDEQKATILQFQNFLNTLDFSIQISVQSRRLDIRPYLLLLENRIKLQNEPLLKLQTKEDIKIAKQEDFEEKRSQLEERVSVIQQGLNRCGIKSAQLGTEEIVELFYKVFNPGELEGKIKME